MGFNGAVFEKLLPLAHAHNLRIVSVNRRGYPPSSGFQEDELKGIGRGKGIKEVEAFCRAQGTEIATFLVKFATEQGIPLVDPNRPAGGIVLIGWSLGTIHALAALAYADELPEDTLSTLQKYLHIVIAHDTSPTALGIPITDRQRAALWRFEADDHKRFNSFFDWATAHYPHKNITSENIDEFELNVPRDIHRSFHELSSLQRTKYTNPEAFMATGCDGKLSFCDPAAFAALTKRALFDKNRAKAFPNVRVRYTSNVGGPGLLVWASGMLRKYLENPKEFYGPDAEIARDIKIGEQAKGNHFIFWDDPEKAMGQYTAAAKL